MIETTCSETVLQIIETGAGTEPQVILTTDETPQVILTINEPGPQGIAGQNGGSIIKVAGESIGGHRVVAADSNGLVIYAGSNHTDRPPIGVSYTAANIGESLAIISSGNEISEPSWSWNMSSPIYAGIDGILTQTPPTSGLLIIVGYPSATTKMVITLTDVILL